MGDWYETTDADGNAYYLNSITGEASWEPPAFIQSMLSRTAAVDKAKAAAGVLGGGAGGEADVVVNTVTISNRKFSEAIPAYDAHERLLAGGGVGAGGDRGQRLSASGLVEGAEGAEVPDWVEYYDQDKGKAYWYDEATGASTYEHQEVKNVHVHDYK